MFLKKLTGCCLIAGLLLSLGACAGTPSTPAGDKTEATHKEQGTEGEATVLPTEATQEAVTDATVEAPEREVYEDLSFNIPAHENSGEKSCTLQSEGIGASCGVKLDFTAMSGRYIISSTKVGFSCHDVATCEDCGYVAEDGGAYLMSSEGLDQGGITVTLANPLLASSVTGMTLTFKTTAEATSSSMRILAAGQSNNAAFVNDCASMKGAVDKWVTVDLGVNDFGELADGDGYIRSFQMYFRNKNKTDCYVQSVDFLVSPDEYLLVDEVDGNCFYQADAVKAVAKAIADRFTASDIKAEVTVKSAGYRGNSSASSGAVRYTATVTLPDGTTITKQHSATVPPLSGAWLDNGEDYGAAHDSLGQWQTTFDPSGMLLLTDNLLSCAEGVKSVEYAVIPEATAFDDEGILWMAPQKLAMSEKGFEHMFVNAFLDMGEQMVAGERYRLLVRGVTNRENYILHTDIPFTYQPLSTEINQALITAWQALAQADFICDESVEDKEAYITEQLRLLVNDPQMAVDVEVLGAGVRSMRLRVSLRHTASVTEARLPVYELDGQVMTDVYNHAGSAFLRENMTVLYDDEVSSIQLVAPYDGDTHIILASKYIYDHAYAPLASIEKVNYGYMAGEFCTPPPVELIWTDANAAEGKAYTVSLSKHRDMSDAMEITVHETKAEVYNLNIGTTYFWQVKSGSESSPVQAFTTEDGYPRFIKMDGVSNVRDIGGFMTADGRRVKQDLAYRSAQLEGITSEGLAVALDQLKIRTDLDLRGGAAAPLGKTVRHISVAMQWYEHIFEEDMYEVVRRSIATFAYEENYPIIFHCSLGRDRTGTTAFLILGLLGVEEDTLRHEYHASSFSFQGAFNPTEFPNLVINMNRLVAGFDDFGNEGDTLQQKIRAYLLHIGVTEAELQSICDIWLED